MNPSSNLKTDAGAIALSFITPIFSNLALDVTRLTPSEIPRGVAEHRVAVTGSGFGPDMKIVLLHERCTDTIPILRILFYSPSVLQLVVDARRVSPGYYDICLARGAVSATFDAVLRVTPSPRKSPMQIQSSTTAVLEHLVGTLTVGELATRVGVDVDTLVRRVTDSEGSNLDRRRTALAATLEEDAKTRWDVERIGEDPMPSRSKRGRPRAQGPVTVGSDFDNAVLATLGKTPLKIAEIRNGLPRSLRSADNIALRAAITRLQKRYVIIAQGNTKSRTYKLTCRTPKADA